MSPFGGGRVRLTGFADFVGYDVPSAEESDKIAALLKSQTKYLMPRLTWKSESPIWFGFRPMSPDGIPYVGGKNLLILSKVLRLFLGKDRHWQNLYLSCGHGSNGWTTSVGSAKIQNFLFFKLDFVVE